MANEQVVINRFLGSSGSRFPGQDSVDISIVPRNPHTFNIQQRTSCLAPGILFCFVEMSETLGNPWEASLDIAFALHFLDFGFSWPLGAVSSFLALTTTTLDVLPSS